jgi:dTDP-4-amino-4,6-dideoxygalactose transaminase
MVLTDDGNTSRVMERLRNHGMDATPGGVIFTLAGYNLRMNEIEACLGIAQMARLDDMVQERRSIATAYDECLAGIDEVTGPFEPEGMVHTYQSYVVMIDEKINRDRLIALMKDKGVETTIGTYAVHAQKFYKDKFGHEPGDLPHSYRAFRQSLSLPIYASMEHATVEQVAESLKDCIHRAITGK